MEPLEKIFLAPREIELETIIIIENQRTRAQTKIHLFDKGHTFQVPILLMHFRINSEPCKITSL